jgi:hypothetical protein
VRRIDPIILSLCGRRVVMGRTVALILDCSVKHPLRERLRLFIRRAILLNSTRVIARARIPRLERIGIMDHSGRPVAIAARPTRLRMTLATAAIDAGVAFSPASAMIVRVTLSRSSPERSNYSAP